MRNRAPSSEGRCRLRRSATISCQYKALNRAIKAGNHRLIFHSFSASLLFAHLLPSRPRPFMHEPLMRPEPELLAPHPKGLRLWTQSCRGALLTWIALMSCAALADVYSEVNEKINASQWQAAQDLIDRQLQKQPTDPQIRLLQSQMQVAQGHVPAAMATLQALTQEFPELPEPYNNLAVLYASQQRYEEALSALQLAVRARPDYSLALENLGDVHIALARQSYLKAQSLPLPSPLMGGRLESKIQRTGQLLLSDQP